MSAIFELLICVLGAVFMWLCGILIYAFCFALHSRGNDCEEAESALAHMREVDDG